MGIHLTVLRGNDYENHPEWDWIRYAGDRDFVDMMYELPTETMKGSDGDMRRPADFAVWRAAIARIEQHNPGRFERLMDILERDTDYWISISW